MKNLIISAFLLLGLTLVGISQAAAKNNCLYGRNYCQYNNQAMAQTNNAVAVVIDSLKVYGRCGMCKTRIETTAKSIKGVNYAYWDDKTNMLKYSHNGKVKKADVSDALIKVGHDTELGKTTDNEYNKLPACCRYR